MALVIATASNCQAQQVIYVVRHAEPAMDGTPNPSLAEAGKRRAEALKELLKDAGVQAIFTTDLKRTQETAKPLADHLMLPAVPLDEAPSALAKRLRAEHPNGRVLLVGHSNTVPDFLREYGRDAAVTVEDPLLGFDSLFVVVPKGGDSVSITRLRYKP